MPSPPTSPAANGRDAQATRRRILRAATDEFAEHGLAGARIARISQNAKANQRMIYAYFESKDGLFRAVLEQFADLDEAEVDLDATDLAGFALRVFDIYKSNPNYLRLTLWQALERPQLGEALRRRRRKMEDKVRAIARAQAEGVVNDAIPADRLLGRILALAHGDVMLAGLKDAWSEPQRQDLAVSIRLLTAPR